MRLTLFLTLITFSSFAQIDVAELKVQADRMANSMLTQQYDTLANHTHPTVIKMLGGRDKLIAALTTAMTDMKNGGYAFESVTLGEPSPVVKAGDELHCIVPQSIVLKMPDGKKLKTRGFLIAVTRNNGGYWYFVDGARLTKDNITTVFPNYNPELKLPEKREPEIIK